MLVCGYKSILYNIVKDIYIGLYICILYRLIYRRIK